MTPVILTFSNIQNVVPPAPQDPPSVGDVISAKKYAQRALIAGGLSSRTLFIPINTRLDAIDARLDGIVVKIDQLTIFASKNYNRTLGDGRPVPFAPVPFPDYIYIYGEIRVPVDYGSLLMHQNSNARALQTPTPLTDVIVLDSLAYDELKAYCEGYYPARAYGNGQRLQERRKSIREAIGCTAVCSV
ncbi:hypothetical protein B0H13DRAFT_2439632 [Mycena leptocephala]|nr:hypothetical protein B0H13DRAFT_2439632 [Mycena leptocephala]